jgi:uncharacterized protein YkwD
LSYAGGVSPAPSRLRAAATALLSAAAPALGCGERPLPPVSVALTAATAPAEAPPAQGAPSAPASAAAVATPPAAPGALWAEPTRSPRLAAPADPLDAPLHALCGDNDRALHRAAEIELARTGQAGALLPADELAFTLRALGDPHVWPRAWSLARPALDETEVAQRLTRFVADGGNAAGVHRCGVARGSGVQGESIVAVVTVDALADLDPLPSTAKVGETVTVRGTLLVPVSGVTAAILGPRGAPRQVPVTMTGGTVALRFVPDQPGAFVVHVRATLQGGERPVLEALVYADAEPPQAFVSLPAPGEDAGAAVADPAEAIARMIGAARKAEGAPPLRRDPLLDAVARAHTDQMVRLRKVAHDLGSGEAPARLSSAGIKSGFIGETVALARDAATVHRAVWGSPNQRGYLLDPRSKRLGVAATTDEAGTWVTEIFTE